jgi:rod shape determining protein RodA
MKDFRNKNISLPLTYFLIVIVGFLALYSASFSKGEINNAEYISHQLLWIILSLVSILFVLGIGYRRLLDFSYVLYGAGILLLIYVILVAQPRLGAGRWVSFVGINIQPSELMKLIFILTLARYLSSYKYQENGIKCVLSALILTGIPVLLIMVQPDLGTALVFIPVALSMLYVWGFRLRYIILMFVAALAASPLFWSLLKDYQKSRLMVFINPNADPLGSGYTIIQSKIAIGSGGIIGKGWLSGTQSQLNFLPEHHTDFIFAGIGEEWGFLGALLIIGLFYFLIIQCLDIALHASSMPKKLLATGISVLIAMQVIINICMCIGLMPVVGLPLPYISYGGSAMIIFSVLIGIIFSIKFEA